MILLFFRKRKYVIILSIATVSGVTLLSPLNWLFERLHARVAKIQGSLTGVRIYIFATCKDFLDTCTLCVAIVPTHGMSLVPAHELGRTYMYHMLQSYVYIRSRYTKVNKTRE